MNIARIQAIFEKDLKDFMKNTATIFMPIVPIFLAFFYNKVGEDGGESLPLMVVYIVVGVTFSTIAAGSMMILMAEENEKKTLRGLIMSPASYLDIIVGKMLVTTFMTIITLVISIVLMGNTEILEFQQIIGMIILFFFFLFLGIGIGLFVKTAGMTTVYSMPIMFIFGFTPMYEFFGFAEDSMITKIIDYMPLMQLIEMGDTGNWSHIGVVAIWAVAAGVFAYICFQRVQKDRT